MLTSQNSGHLAVLVCCQVSDFVGQEDRLGFSIWACLCTMGLSRLKGKRLSRAVPTLFARDRTAFKR